MSSSGTHALRTLSHPSNSLCTSLLRQGLLILTIWNSSSTIAAPLPLLCLRLPTRQPTWQLLHIHPCLPSTRPQSFPVDPDSPSTLSHPPPIKIIAPQNSMKSSLFMLERKNTRLVSLIPRTTNALLLVIGVAALPPLSSCLPPRPPLNTLRTARESTPPLPARPLLRPLRQHLPLASLR